MDDLLQHRSEPSTLPFVTKVVVPQRRSAILSRPRLLAFLHEYLDRKLILMSASAGYGKTTLLIDFARDTELPVCWFSLDKGDRDPQVFLAYLLASLQRQFPQFGSRTQALLRDANSTRVPDQIIGTLVTEIHDQIASYFVLVLDDYHLVDSSAPINQIVDNLLSSMPDNAHVIMASRTVPSQITLTRLAARMQVAGLGSDDLRFTASEIREFIQQNYSLSITDSVAQQLADQSEGWIASIVLTTPTLWQGLFKDWVKARGAGSQLFDYLATEVLEQEPHELQLFLGETSILDQMDAGLCNELLGITDSQAQLDVIEARNLFIFQMEDRTYRYHHLFQEFLQTELARSRPERFRALLGRAAEIFEQRGLDRQAIDYWLKGNHFARAKTAIESSIGQAYTQGGWGTIARWLDALPPSLLQSSPQLLLWRGRIHSRVGELADAVRVFEKAHAEFQDCGDRTNLARVLIEEAIVARFQARHGECLEKCQAALTQLDPRESSLVAQAHRTMGASLAAQGNVRGSIDELERALELYRLADDRFNTGLVEDDLGAAQTLIGNRSEAARHFDNALRYWRTLGNSACIANTLNSIGVGNYYAGELDQSHAVLEQALQEARRAGSIRIEGYILAGLGDVYRGQGNFEHALRADTDAFQIAERIREAFLLTCALTGLSYTWRLAGDLRLAEQLSLQASDAARVHRSDYEMALAGCAFGATQVEQGKYEEAISWLDRASHLLEQQASPRDARRILYFLALAHFRLKRFDEAADDLKALAAAGDYLQDDGWLLTEGSRAVTLAKFALKRHVDDAYFRPVLGKLRRNPTVPQHMKNVVESPWPRLEIRTLGAADVFRAGSLIPKTAWQTQATKELFLLLALNPNPWRKEQILAALWPDKPVPHANDMLHSSIYRIRRAVFHDVLLFRDGKYQLNPEGDYWVDVNEFKEALDKVSRADAETGTALLRRAIELYRGDFLDEVYSEWPNSRREQMREKYIGALVRLGEFEKAAGHFDQALAAFEAALDKDNQREPVYQALMRLHWELGQRTQALQVYERCLRSLADELGVPPMPETTALYQEILKSH